MGRKDYNAPGEAAKKMAPSFLQRFLGGKKAEAEEYSLTGKPVRREVKARDSDVQQPRQRPPEEQFSETAEELNSLFAFVDLKDPFTPGEVAGEELPGPILSIMDAKQFSSAYLFHTPHTRENALGTKAEITQRYPECVVQLHELAVADPKDYSSLMGQLGLFVRKIGNAGRMVSADHNGGSDREAAPSGDSGATAVREGKCKGSAAGLERLGKHSRFGDAGRVFAVAEARGLASPNVTADANG
jgi:hypothetical protein